MNEFQISSKEKNRGSLLDVTRKWKFYSIKIWHKKRTESLNVDRSMISRCLKAIETIQKQGNWCRTSWSRGTSKSTKWSVNYCFKDRRKSFCVVSWRVIKNGYATIIRSTKNHGVGQMNHQHRQQSWIFMAPSSCSVFGGISWVLWVTPIQRNYHTTNNNWCNWAKHWSKNNQITREDTTKWFSHH